MVVWDFFQKIPSLPNTLWGSVFGPTPPNRRPEMGFQVHRSSQGIWGDFGRLGNMIVKLDHLPRDPAENKNCLKPPVLGVCWLWLLACHHGITGFWSQNVLVDIGASWTRENVSFFCCAIVILRIHPLKWDEWIQNPPKILMATLRSPAKAKLKGAKGIRLT